MSEYQPLGYLLEYLINESVSYAVIGGSGYLGWRFVRAYERRSHPRESLEALNARVAQLEDAVDRVAANVEHTVDAQRFTTRVLLGRSVEQNSSHPW